MRRTRPIYCFHFVVCERALVSCFSVRGAWLSNWWNMTNICGPLRFRRNNKATAAITITTTAATKERSRWTGKKEGNFLKINQFIVNFVWNSLQFRSKGKFSLGHFKVTDGHANWTVNRWRSCRHLVKVSAWSIDYKLSYKIFKFIRRKLWSNSIKIN